MNTLELSPPLSLSFSLWFSSRTFLDTRPPKFPVMMNWLGLVLEMTQPHAPQLFKHRKFKSEAPLCFLAVKSWWAKRTLCGTLCPPSWSSWLYLMSEANSPLILVVKPYERSEFNFTRGCTASLWYFALSELGKMQVQNSCVYLILLIGD